MTLTDEQFELIQLARCDGGDGLSNAEIADQVACTVGNVEGALKAAYRRAAHNRASMLRVECAQRWMVPASEDREPRTGLGGVA